MPLEKARTSLFDIAACKCKTLLTCSCEECRKTSCQRSIFILDQRFERKMVTIYLVKTEIIKKPVERKNKEIGKHTKIAIENRDNEKSSMSKCMSDLCMEHVERKDMTRERLRLIPDLMLV